MEAVKLLKFRGKTVLVGPMADVMTEFAKEELDADAYDFVIPVPLYRVRQRERGFNQARLLAAQILPLFQHAQLDESLKRIRPTYPQTRLESDAERRANVANAFAVQHGEHLRKKTVLLIDDVVTTGQTVSACAAALRHAGAAAVDAFALALA